MSFKDRDGEVGIFKVDGNRAFAIWSTDKGIQVVNVDFRLHQGGRHKFQIRFIMDFGSDDRGLKVVKACFSKNFPCQFRIIDDHPHRRKVRRIQLGYGDYMEILGCQQEQDFLKAPHLVVGKDRELNDRLALSGRRDFSRHFPSENDFPNSMGEKKRMGSGLAMPMAVAKLSIA